MDSLDEKTFTTSRKLTYRYYTSKPLTFDASKPTLLLQHGWPDSALLWQYILPHLQKLPFRLIVPDLLGYGGTSKPTDPALYASGAMVTDLIELLDSENVDKIISIGHDWGSYLAQRVLYFHPSRVVGLVMLSVYSTKPGGTEDFDLAAVNATLEQHFGSPLYAYWHLFTDPSQGPAIFDRNTERAWLAQHGDDPEFMKNIFCTRNAMKAFMTASDPSAPSLRPYARDPALKDRWIADMKAGGWDAPFCWYRAVTEGHSARSEKALPESASKVGVPSLWIGSDQDAVCFDRKTYHAAEFTDLTIHEIRGAAHWIPYERPDEVAGFVVDWLKCKSF